MKDMKELAGAIACTLIGLAMASLLIACFCFLVTTNWERALGAFLTYLLLCVIEMGVSSRGRA